MLNSPKSFTKSGHIKSPGYKLAIEWISQIWRDLDKDIIINSLQKCGITSNESEIYYSQLRNFINSNEFAEDVEMVLEDTSDIEGFDEEDGDDDDDDDDEDEDDNIDD